MAAFAMEYADDPTVTEFVCFDCSISVFATGSRFTVLPPRCGTCQWIADIPDPADRAACRAFLAVDD